LTGPAFVFQLVSTLNDIEHILQYVAALPHELDFEDDTRASLSSYDDSNGEMASNDPAVEIASSVSINITGIMGGISSNSSRGLQRDTSQFLNNNNNTQWPIRSMPPVISWI
jgi:phospholipase/lecithinase/hemolysin